MRRHVSSASPWEERVGYSRAVRAGNLICVSGTTAFDEQGALVGENDAYEQTIQAIRNVESALLSLGASLENVVRTHLYVVEIDRDWEAVGKAHFEFFHSIRPATSMLEVKRLIHPAMLVEIEADAWADDDPIESE